MKNYEAVIFDLDGTLLDTLEDLADSVNASLEAYRHPRKTLGQIRSYVGNGIRKLMERSLEGGENNPDFENVFEEFNRHYKGNCWNKTKPYDGVAELLQKLKSEGMKMAIVSNKANFAVKELNEHFFKEFGMIAIGERQGVARKPEPDMVALALQELHMPLNRAVYVGDSEIDVMTAANAGLPCISVLWGFREREVLERYGARQFAGTAEELLALLLP